MIKKIGTFLLAILFVTTILPMSIFPVLAANNTGTTDSCTWTLDDTVLTISGNGEMRDYFYGREDPPLEW